MTTTAYISTSVGSFDFKQVTASDTWTITHNLNTTAPIVDCYIWNDDLQIYQKILPNAVTVVDVTTVRISFTQAYMGVATVI
jgi:hypothetical protein